MLQLLRCVERVCDPVAASMVEQFGSSRRIGPLEKQCLDVKGGSRQASSL